MHVIFRETHGLDDAETPKDLAQSPADLVVLSLSDSDLGAFAEGWRLGGGPDGNLPSLRLANIAALKHPLSVDTYIEQTLSGAKGILIRLIGGVPYWPYGLQQIEALARENAIPLAVLPGDGRRDDRLDAISTLPASTLERLRHLCDIGGAAAAQAALAQMALACGLYAAPARGAKGVPPVGGWSPEHGLTCPIIELAETAPRVLVVFYRSFLVAADLAPIEALFDELRATGFQPIGLFVPSLKEVGAAGWLERQLRFWRPCAIVNATAFSGRRDGGASPLDAADVPVFQVALATSTEAAWSDSERGLSPSDLAMHVVLPEVDGRIFTGALSFKEPQARDPALEFSRFMHRPKTDHVTKIAQKIRSWTDLAAKPAAARRIALVLSTYPGRAWNIAHAVGLDAIASADAILEDLAQAGHYVTPGVTAETLGQAEIIWPFERYQAALKTIPPELTDALQAAWGRPEDDRCARKGGLALPVAHQGRALICLQPERGLVETRDLDYHDLSRTPCHAYVAFYLWLREHADAILHIGAHGTLEWLPGKAVALSQSCWPEALIGTLPVLYPFIVNDPGEAAQAKRRIGAVTLGHVPPALKQSGAPARLARLESLLDEFSNADGLDPRRRDRLQDDIRAEARALGVEEDLGIAAASCSAEAITSIDRFVCDVKDSQFGDGLHIWGRISEQTSCAFDITASAAAERDSLLKALNGKRIAPGPSGSPYRGRLDVLPTGRNLFTTDPRAVPTRAAYMQGTLLADELIRRHLQDQGDWPKGLVIDLWGSATMRTAGEEFAMALALLGVRPVWDAGSERVSGVDVLPIAELDRPRIDVTLRVSGLFRDVFPSLPGLFAKALRVLSDRDEAPDWNPYVAGSPGARVFGPEPGRYGVGMGAFLAGDQDDAREAAGQAWLAASSWSYDDAEPRSEPGAIRERVAHADTFVHLQDLPETDLLLSEDYAAHEAGFAAAKALTGGEAALWHLDNTDPARPRTRALREEIARVVQARASHPGWLAGMQRHGFRGAAEIAATLENMAAFAHLAGIVPAHLFDLYFEATLGDDVITAFMAEANPAALEAMRNRFAALHDAGLWRSRRNSIRAALEAAS